MAERAFAPISTLAGMALAMVPMAAPASPEKDAVKDLIKAVKQGSDLSAAYPGAVSSRENASLQRVAKCSATNLMKQQGGYYTVVWDCGSNGALAMKVVLKDGKIGMVTTEGLSMQPNVGSR